MITDYEREQILGAGSFLEEKGYKIQADEYSISYSNGDIRFSFTYPPYEETSQASIRFKGINEVFYIDWIALVREQINVDGRKKLLNILALMGFIREHYEEITDYSYCKQSDELIDRYVEQHREKYEKAVRDFLELCRKS